MQNVLLILLQLVSSQAKLVRPARAKALVAENLLLKQRLLILCRSRRRAPNLRFSDRFLFGLISLFLIDSPCSGRRRTRSGAWIYFGPSQSVAISHQPPHAIICKSIRTGSNEA